MSDLTELHYCLQVEFERNREACINTMNQRSYIEDILKHFNIEECKPVGTLFDVNSKLLKPSNEEFKNVQRKMKGVSYKAKVLRYVMYAMVAMRADITFLVSTVSQFMSKVGPPYWMAMERIMRYLKSTLDFKLCLGGKNIVLGGFCDADWARDANDRQSTIGYMFFCGCWSPFLKMQETTIALSMAETWSMVTSDCTKEAVWFR